MAGWEGVIMALSLLVIAICVSGFTAMTFIALKEAKDRGESLSREVAQLRADLAPTLESIKRLGEKGLDVANLAQEEAKEIIATTRRVRYDVERGVKRAKRRLADFEAVIDVVQEEVEATALDVTAAMHTARTGAGVIGQLRRLVRATRRGAA
jgi:uncharacterized protein involved in exopolysaccharide biosynthesis